MQLFELRGDGVLLAAPTPDDIDIITEICQDAEIQRWTTVPVPYTREDAEKFLSDIVEPGWESGKNLTWAIRDPENRAVLGMIGLHERDASAAEVGFWLSPDIRGQGIMMTALRLVAEYARDPDGGAIQRLIWRASVGNWTSRRVAWRLGFQYEGIARQGLLKRGQRDDTWVASLLAGDPMTPSGTWFDVPTLTGSRVRLRRFTESDAEAIVETCTDEVTRHWLGSLPDPYTTDVALGYIRTRENEHAAGAAVHWAAERPGGSDAIGSFSLMGIREGHAEVGYWVHPKARGAGVATEAVQLTVRHAFAPEAEGGLGLRRLTLARAEGNDASAIVAERAGFTEFGVGSAAEKLGDGSWVDLHWYELLATTLASG